MLLQNQAKAVYCHGFASHEQAFATSASEHTHLVEFAHMCACYSKVATISFTELQVRLGCHSWVSTIRGAASISMNILLKNYHRFYWIMYHKGYKFDIHVICYSI